MIALFCGSRGWTEARRIWEDVTALPDDSIVVHGGARGADEIAGRIATTHGFHVAEVKALWSYYNRSAGHKRNAAMLRLKPDVVYAYTLGTPGTAGMIAAAQRAGIEVIVREATVHAA